MDDILSTFLIKKRPQCWIRMGGLLALPALTVSTYDREEEVIAFIGFIVFSALVNPISPAIPEIPHQLQAFEALHVPIRNGGVVFSDITRG
jgi:hypothetical protein